MTVRIIADSASDLDEAFARAHGITLVPLITSFKDGEYQEGVNLTREEFFVKLAACDELPRTSQVPPAHFQRVFEQVVAAGDTAVVVVLSSRLSGTYNSAMVAREGLENSIFVVDSMNVSLGELVLVKRAVILRDEGHSAAEVAATLENEKNHIRVFALLNTLDYLKKGGRISVAAALAGGLLSIKPIIGVEAGEIVMRAKTNGLKRGMRLMRELIAQEGIDFTNPIRFGFSGLADTTLKQFLAESHEIFDGMKQRFDSGIIGATVGTHIGPGAIGAAFFTRKCKQA